MPDDDLGDGVYIAQSSRMLVHRDRKAGSRAELSGLRVKNHSLVMAMVMVRS